MVYGVGFFAIAIALGLKVQGLRRFLPAAILWHIVVFLFISLWVMPFYAPQGSDAYWYHHEAIKVADLIRAGHFGKINLDIGTFAVPTIMAIFYAPFGGDVYGMLFLCSSLSLLSAVIFVRAFTNSFHSSAGFRYCYYILFMPSISMWTSSIGKDTIVALGLALTAYGIARAFKNEYGRALLPFCSGIALVGIIRIHIAFVIIIAAAAAALWPQLRSRRTIRLGMALLLLGIGASIIPITARFVGLNVFTLDSVEERRNELAAGNNYGGSKFEQDGTTNGSLASLPIGMWNLFVRPYPWEAHNSNAALAAAENVFLISLVAFALGRARQMWSSIHMNRYLLFCAFVAAALLVLFSGIQNAGLLSRQRVQVLPFLLAVLLCTPARRVLPSKAHWPISFQGRRLFRLVEQGVVK